MLGVQRLCVELKSQVADYPLSHFRGDSRGPKGHAYTYTYIHIEGDVYMYIYTYVHIEVGHIEKD